MTTFITREDLLRRGVRGGAALVVAGAAVSALAESASADPLPTNDLAYARLLVGAELLASDFYSQAIAASERPARSTKYLKRAYLNEQQHYQSVAGILSGAGRHAGGLGRHHVHLPGRDVRVRGVDRQGSRCQLESLDARHLPRRDRRDPDELAAHGARPDRRLRGAAQLVLHLAMGGRYVQPLVPAGARRSSRPPNAIATPTAGLGEWPTTRKPRNQHDERGSLAVSHHRRAPGRARRDPRALLAVGAGGRRRLVVARTVRAHDLRGLVDDDRAAGRSIRATPTRSGARRPSRPRSRTALLPTS